MQPPHHANQQILNIEVLEHINNPRKPLKKIPGMKSQLFVYYAYFIFLRNANKKFSLFSLDDKIKQSLLTFLKVNK